MKKVTSFIACMLLLFSCVKRDVAALELLPEGRQVSDTECGKTLWTIEKAPSVALLSGANSVCDSSPFPGTWYIKQSYLNAYQHFCQIDAKPEYPGAVLCGPTSYMLGVHMILATKGNVYPSTKAKIGAIYGKLKLFGKFDDDLGMYIGDLQWFCSHYDYPVVKTSYKRTTDRALMKEYIEYNLKSGYPVVVTVQIYANHGATWALHDAELYDKLGESYYVSKNGSIGHYILLIGIKINADGSGIVWYKDPLSKSGITQSASYTRVLDAMKYNGNNDYYDAVALFE